VNILSKLQPVFIILSAFVGIIIGKNIDGIALYSDQLIKYFLMLLLLFVFLNINIKEITKSFLNIRFSLSALVINFIWTPLFAFFLTRLFFKGEIDVQLGYIMLMVTPCTDWYLIFTALSKGNVPLGSSILPLNLLLQIILLPIYILIFMGSIVRFDVSMILESIVFVLIIPLTIASIIKIVLGKSPMKNNFERFISMYSDNIQFLFLCLAIISMFASQGNHLIENPMLFITILPPLIIFFILNFFLAFFAGKKLALSTEDRIPLIFTSTARNSPISLAIASVTFPDKPIVLLVLALGPIIELPILAIYSMILKKVFKK
jgi:ACR3 family arsenite efflux pump ArsB